MVPDMPPRFLAELEPSLSVLVVDDDRPIRDTLREILQDEGYIVSTAGNGAEALEILKHRRPRVILLDLNMPTMNGGEFRLVQRFDPALRRIPTVVFTAADRMSERVAELEPD